jgi:peptidyl-prolyl cis-trans isomerase C
VRRLIAIVVVVALTACSKTTPADAKTQTSASPAATPAAAAPAAPAAPPKPVPAQIPDVIATVNGEVINKAEFDAAVQALEGRAGGPMPSDQRDRILRGMLDDMIAFKLLVQEVAARKIVVPDADIDAQIAKVRSQFPSDAQFQQALAAQKVTLEKLRDNARTQLGVEKLLESEVAGKIAVTPAAIEDFYKKNLDKFQQTARVRASHVLISIPQNADAATKEKAKAKAEAVLAEIKGGKDFAVVAKENSQDPGSAASGGDLGFFQQGQMVPAFDEVAFKLNPGEMSGVVESPFGFHIIKVAEKQAARVVPLEEAKPQIEQFLTGQNRQTQAQAFVSALKAKAKIDIRM